MTSAELRRLAAAKMNEATALGSDADRLRVQAAALRGLLDPLVSISHRVWTGPAAQDFEAKAQTQARIVNDQSSRLAAIAGELDDRAYRLRREAESLRRQADAAAQPPGPAPLGVAASGLF